MRVRLGLFFRLIEPVWSLWMEFNTDLVPPLGTDPDRRIDTLSMRKGDLDRRIDDFPLTQERIEIEGLSLPPHLSILESLVKKCL